MLNRRLTEARSISEQRKLLLDCAQGERDAAQKRVTELGTEYAVAMRLNLLLVAMLERLLLNKEA